MKVKVNKTTIQILKSDLLTPKVDAIINSTDTSLSIPSWLSPLLNDAVKANLTQIGWCEVGNAIATVAGSLPYRILIHVVPPKWGEGSERGKLANAMWEVLDLAEAHQCKSIALPPLAVGTEGYPLENSAKTMLEQIIDFSFEPSKFLKLVIICAYSNAEETIFINELKKQFDDLPDGDKDQVSAF
jgi:O-acetyl-ADP-ribose deacetylase